MGMYCETIQEARSLQSRGWQGPAPSKTRRGELFPPRLILAPAVAGSPWYPLVYSSRDPVSVLVIMWHSPCVCVFTQFSSYKDNCHIELGVQPTLV